MLLSKAFRLEYPFFTVIAAIFSMENSMASSYKAGVYRLVGTVAGACVGVAFIFIQPGNPFLMGIGILVLILICNTFRWDRAVPIAGVVFASIMLSLNNKNPLYYSLSRVLDTFVGITIAVLVNYFVFPPDNLGQMRKRVEVLSLKISAAAEDLISFGRGADLQGLRREAIECLKTLEAYQTEFHPKPGGNTEFFLLGERLESLRGILSHLKTVEELRPVSSQSPESMVYKYHVDKILDALKDKPHQG